MLALLVLGGCATVETPVEAQPVHPFPEWVRALEPGMTPISDVEARFGSPAMIEAGPHGEEVWRYSFSEVHWAPGAKHRPQVAAKNASKTDWSAKFDRAKNHAGNALRGVGRLVMYPPAQPRPPRTKTLPATIHELELVFEGDGTLRHVEYTPEEGMARVPLDD